MERGWATAGHEIVFGVRDPKDAKVQEVVQSAEGRTRARTVREAVASSKVVVLATPWPATRGVVTAAGSLSGTILVDATNPLKADPSGLAIGHMTSAAEQVASSAAGAKVVKAFNTIGALHMTNPSFGDPGRACSRVGATLRPSGPWPPWPRRSAWSRARLLEALATLWISMAYAYGQGTNIALRLLRK